MRIAQITTLFHPHCGGIETMARSLARGLSEGGNHCEVLTRRTRGLTAEDEVDGVTVHRLGGAAGGRRLAQARFLASGRLRLRRDAATLDIVHAHSLYSPALLAAASGIPAVATLHTVGPTGNLADLLGTPWGRLRLRLYRRRLARVIALSRSMADELIGGGFAEQQIAIIPNGVDPDRHPPASDADRRAARLRLGLDPDRPHVVFFGRFAHEKGLDVLLEAWPAIAAHAPEAQLLVAGRRIEQTGHERAGIAPEAAAARAQVIEDPDEPRDIYHAADVIVVPSRTEAFGLVALEAAAAGVPVVASRVGGLPEALGDAGILVAPEDPPALAAATAALLADAAHRARLGRAARQRVLAHFTLARVVAAHRELYAQVREEAVRAAPRNRSGSC